MFYVVVYIYLYVLYNTQRVGTYGVKIMESIAEGCREFSTIKCLVKLSRKLSCALTCSIINVNRA